MQERDTYRDRDNLYEFLDFAGEKGLMKKATAGAYKKASATILAILDNTEASDLAKINLDDVILRHRNLVTGRMVPATLKTYETRVRAAVGNFIEYTKDPSSWKPAVQQRTVKVSKVKKTKSGGSVSEHQTLEELEGIRSQPAVHIDFQIHISPEVTPEQIDQIFASMREHLYPKQND